MLQNAKNGGGLDTPFFSFPQIDVGNICENGRIISDFSQLSLLSLHSIQNKHGIFGYFLDSSLRILVQSWIGKFGCISH